MVIVTGDFYNTKSLSFTDFLRFLDVAWGLLDSSGGM